MTEIRTKDKLFLALAVPAALVAAYWFGWRENVGKRVDSLSHREAELVAPADFDIEMARAKRSEADAEAELAAEQAIPAPATQVKATTGESEAERTAAVVETFRSAGLKIVRNEVVDNIDYCATATSSLQASGACPRPICRAWTVAGTYPAVASALAMFEKNLSPVIPVSVVMPSPRRWTITLCQ